MSKKERLFKEAIPEEIRNTGLWTQPTWRESIPGEFTYGRVKKGDEQKENPQIEQVTLRGDFLNLESFIKRAQQTKRFRFFSKIETRKKQQEKRIIFLRQALTKDKAKLRDLEREGVKLDILTNPWRISSNTSTTLKTPRELAMFDESRLGFRNRMHELIVEAEEEEKEALEEKQPKRQKKKTTKQIIQSLLKAGFSKEEVTQALDNNS